VSLDLQPEAVFAGRYRVLRRIAAGGMGAVYEVLHIETDRRRALKVMLPEVFHSDDLRRRFKQEAKVAARIESEFIVEVFDAGVDDATRTPFLVMELLRGEELGKRVKRLGPLPPADVVAYLHQTALALDKTHRASIVHRDLKPANLFLAERDDRPPCIKVLDFGVAKVVAEAQSINLTQSVGTPAYMAPEQFVPSARLTGAADVYALGMVAYTLLVGRAYWAEEARANVFALASVAVQGPRDPASLRAAKHGVSLPPLFDAWFARITAVRPEARFPTATEAVRALADALGLAPPARPSETSLGDTSFTASAAQVSAPVALQVSGAAPGTTPAFAPQISAAPIATPASAAPARSRAGSVLAVVAGAAALLGAGAYGVVALQAAPPAPAAATTSTAPPPSPPVPPPPASSPAAPTVSPAVVSASAAPTPPVKPVARPRPVVTVPLHSRD
jgi:serine/threonine protein kinase